MQPDRYSLLTYFGRHIADFHYGIAHIGAGSNLEGGDLLPFREMPIDQIRIYKFESDPDTLAPGDTHPNVSIFPHALSNADGERRFYVYRNTGASSFFLPNADLISRWHYGAQNLGELHSVTEERMVATRSLDSLMADGAIGGLDLLRLNIQGGELDVLNGAGRALDQALAIMIELSFNHTYIDAPLFSDIDPVLRRSGFSFFDSLHLNEITHAPMFGRQVANERYWRCPSRQVFEGHFLYVKDFVHHALDPLKLLKLAVSAEIFGQVSFAYRALEQARALCTGDEKLHAIIDRAIADFIDRWRDDNAEKPTGRPVNPLEKEVSALKTLVDLQRERIESLEAKLNEAFIEKLKREMNIPT